MIHCEGLVKIYRIGSREVVALQGLSRAPRGRSWRSWGRRAPARARCSTCWGAWTAPPPGSCRSGDGTWRRCLRRCSTATGGRAWASSGSNRAETLIGYLTALENVMAPMQLARVPAARAGSGPRSSSRRWGWVSGWHTCRHSLREQRVAIAVALANRPALLLADEPTGELDLPRPARSTRSSRALVQRYEITVVIVSHDPHIALYVDRVVSIRDGKPAPRRSGRSADRQHGGSLFEYVVVDLPGDSRSPRT